MDEEVLFTGLPSEKPVVVSDEELERKYGALVRRAVHDIIRGRVQERFWTVGNDEVPFRVVIQVYREEQRNDDVQEQATAGE